MPARVFTFAERQARAARNRALRAAGQPTPHSVSKGSFGLGSDPVEPQRPGLPTEGGTGHSPPPTIQGSAKRVLEIFRTVPTYKEGWLDEAQQSALCEIIEIGNFPHHAAEALGIPRQSLQDWMRMAKVGDEPYLSLMKRINAARGRSVTVLVARIRDAADYVSWQAAVRMLESMSADDWMRSEKRVEDVGSVFKELLLQLADARRGQLSPGKVVDVTAMRGPQSVSLQPSQSSSV